MKKLLYIIPVLLTVVVFIMIPVTVHAADPPDNTPTLDRIRVYRNLLESGDMCFVWQANTPYATVPDTTFPDTYIWRVVDTDNVTTLGSTTGYAYEDDGYNYNVFSAYFSASDVTAKGMIWGTAYIIRLSGNPIRFADPPEYNFFVTSSDYTTETTETANKAEFATEILYLAADLSVKWGLTVDYYLTFESETGTVLSIYGEQVFRGAIYGVQALAPAAFRFIVADMDAPDRAWNNTYITSLETQYSGSWVETALNASRDLLGTSYDLTSLILLCGICITAFMGNLFLTSDHWNGLIDVMLILVIASKMGIFGLAFIGLIGAIAMFYIGVKIWNMIPR